jgi:hypothetical protein
MRMYYRPAPPPPEPDSLITPLARKLAVFLFDYDLSSQEFTHPTGPVRVDTSNLALVGYLQGLAACEVDGAADLLEELTHSGAVMLWIGDHDDF